MSIIDTLITNRTQADVDALQALYAKPKAMWTADEWNEFLLGNHRGAYNASDMNRVLDALDYLAERVTEFGYRKPEIKRPSIAETIETEVQSRLPEGYTELEYIRSSGTQYIDTLVVPTQNTRVVVDFQKVAANTWVFGCRVSYSTNQFDLFTETNTGKFWRIDLGSVQNEIQSTMLDERTQADISFGLVKVGETSMTPSTGSLSTTLPIFLFGLNNNGTARADGNVKIYSCQIYDNDVLVRDFIPCIKLSGEIGLYDIVNGEFYGNSGTGTFVEGPDVGGTIMETIVRDYYKIGDRPPKTELANYLDNVAHVRGVLDIPSDTPAVPADISQRITVEEANNIEIILTAVELLLNRIPLSWFYAGEIYSGEV